MQRYICDAFNIKVGPESLVNFLCRQHLYVLLLLGEAKPFCVTLHDRKLLEACTCFPLDCSLLALCWFYFIFFCCNNSKTYAKVYAGFFESSYWIIECGGGLVCPDPLQKSPTSLTLPFSTRSTAGTLGCSSLSPLLYSLNQSPSANSSTSWF